MENVGKLMTNKDVWDKNYMLQKQELKLLEIWNNFTETMKIPYTLLKESLWQAVQYSGFIPWEHGLYLLIERKNLSLFYELFQKFFGEVYYLESGDIWGYHQDLAGTKAKCYRDIEDAFYIRIRSKDQDEKDIIFNIYLANKENPNLQIRRIDLLYRRLMESRILSKNIFFCKKGLKNRLKYENKNSAISYIDRLQPSIFKPDMGVINIDKIMNIAKVKFNESYAYIPVEAEDIIQKLYGIKKYELIDLKKIQYALLELLKLYHNICKCLGVKYSLASGTLLGAIRDDGFIPWDDDVDVVMDIPDYKKFLDMANPLLHDRAKVFRTKADDGQSLGGYYAVLESENKIILSDGKSVKPYIDIFPLNRESNYDFIRKLDIIYREKLEQLRRTNWKRLKNHDIKDCRVKRINKILLEAIIKNREKYNNSINKNTFADYFHPHPEESSTKIIKIDLYCDIEMKTFEDEQFYVAKHYNQILKMIFGNWKEYPNFKNQLPVHFC